MSSVRITMARVYLMEGQDDLDQVLTILHDEEKVSDVTVIRGIAGYDESGNLHTSTILSLSLELPLVVEFFDQSERIERVINVLQRRLHLKHIISWPAFSHIENSTERNKT